jgi:hypothetical protein
MARNRFAAALTIALILALVGYEYAVAHHILPGIGGGETAEAPSADE